MEKVKCIEIELAIMREFDFRRNLIVPNISNMMNIVAFETDMLVLNERSYAHGFEIKVTKSDLKADFKKKHHQLFDQMKNGKKGLERFYAKFKHFSYAVPEDLKDEALSIIPEWCGLWLYQKNDYPLLDRFYCERPARKLFEYKWTDKERYQVARLGTMRIYNLKKSLDRA